jgi:hypothetical protein
MIYSMPLELSLDQTPDIVLIDDDFLIRKLWENSARTQGKRLTLFSNPEDFYTQADSFDSNTEIYVDVDLGSGYKGEHVAEKALQLGFSKIYLTTGYPAHTFQSLKWLSGVVGKEPPWGKLS